MERDNKSIPRKIQNRRGQTYYAKLFQLRVCLLLRIDNTEASDSGVATDLETTWLVAKEEFAQQRQLAEATMT
jgi:hypothetical protein